MPMILYILLAKSLTIKYCVACGLLILPEEYENILPKVCSYPMQVHPRTTVSRKEDCDFSELPQLKVSTVPSGLPQRTSLSSKLLW